MSIDRYLLGDLLRPFAAILGILVVLFAGFSLAETLADFSSTLLPVGVIAAIAALRVLIALDVLVPISLFIAVVMAFGRLQEDSEVTMMHALGMSPSRVARPVMLLAATLAASVGCLSLVVRPWAYTTSHLIAARAAVLMNVDAMDAGLFYQSGDGRQVVFLGKRAGRHEAAHGVFVARTLGDHLEVISAQGADPLGRDAAGFPVVRLSNAHLYELYPDKAGGDEALEGGGLDVDPQAGTPAPPLYSPVAASSLHLARSDRPADIAELQWRLSTGISTLLLALLGLVLSGGRPRQNRYAKFGTAILSYAAYYLLCTTARAFIEHGHVGRFPGLWWAPAGLAAVVTALWFRTELGRFAADILRARRPHAV